MQFKFLIYFTLFAQEMQDVFCNLAFLFSQKRTDLQQSFLVKVCKSVILCYFYRECVVLCQSTKLGLIILVVVITFLSSL